MSPSPPLPDYALRLLPELADAALPDEVRATCDRCAMAPEHRPERDHPRSFTAEPRCCTYIPTIANFVAGRILRRGDAGARRMLARLQSIDEGVGRLAVEATKAQLARYLDPDTAFGQYADLTCPYWVGGPRACAIWADRNGVCRSWHCRYVDGEAGFRRWTDLRTALTEVEGRLAAWCVAQGEPPEPGADRDAWIAWYLWCAAEVDTVDPEVIRPYLRADALQAATRATEPIPPLVVPDVLMSSVSSWRVRPDAVELYGYSSLDACMAPPWIFLFLSRLDGRTRWQDAAAALRDATGHEADAALISTLVARGALSVPAPEDVQARPGAHMVIRSYEPAVGPADPPEMARR
jgi:hypothetical protein